MIKAWKNRFGTYDLVDEVGSKGETWDRREEIVRLGGVWQQDSGMWNVEAHAVDKLGALRVYGVIREPFCHERMMFMFADHLEVADLKVRRNFCSGCDSLFGWYNVSIIEVCGEADVARQVYESQFKADVEATWR